MPLKIFNTASRKKEAFKPAGDEVKMYSCGPTVYNYAHIGNMRAYVVADLLRRHLKYSGYGLKHVMNITDVDDKTIRDSRAQGISLKQLTDTYTKAFFSDLETLNIEKVEEYPRATAHIAGMVELVKALMRKGYAYKGSDAIYFDISKFKGYGKMAHLDMSGLKAGARVSQDEYDKGDARDFALWKFWDEKDGDVFWDTEIGKGRPGWHIECSAMSMKYLGPSLDIHTGGVDLVFPHHQNEVAQSEAATGKKFVKYWVHNEHLLVDGKKMSKSLGNFFTLRDLIGKGHKPMAIRYLLLASHYRQKLNLTEEGLRSAQQSVVRLADFASRCRSGRDGEGMENLAKEAKSAFKAAMDDDLNTPLALSAVFDFMNKANAIGAGKVAYGMVKELDSVLGLRLCESESWKPASEASGEAKALMLRREEERKRKNWKEADRIRSELASRLGVTVEDSKAGPVWKNAES